tara:strand:+ start:6863 stop:7909 length:1047 start_codon:yes stop_codon:yes gene_type:complete
MILKNKITDPLQDLQLDSFQKLNDLLNINHHSPSAEQLPLGFYVFSRLFCTQEERRLFDGNANMAAGVATGDAIQFHYADTIWKFNPNQKKLAPHKNKKISKEEAIEKAIEKFSNYVPVNDKDKDKKEKYLETIPQTIRQAFIVFDQLGADKATDIIAEDSINHTDSRLALPIVGRTDLHFKDFKSVEQSADATSPSHVSSDAMFLSVLELKTTWQTPGKIKKDGSRSFSLARLPSSPNKNHLKQLAFYNEVKKPCNPKLVYVTADGFQVFTKENCADLEPKNLHNYYEALVKGCMRIERLLARHIDLDDPEMILKEIVKDVDPDFDSFYWNIGHEFLNKAKKIWSSV